MGENYLSNVRLLMPDGTSVEIVEIDEFSDTVAMTDGVTYLPDVWRFEMTGPCEFSISKKWLNFFRHGWRAKGPVRKRLLDRLVISQARRRRRA